MGKPDAKLQKQIDESIGNGNIQSAFETLSGFEDLKHADLPAISKTSLKKVSENPQASRELCLGLAHPSVSVRRFCKKYVPKLGSSAATCLLFLAVENIDPFRPVSTPGDGLLGSFGGYASPVAQFVREKKMSFEIKSPAAYSAAGKYYAEVMELSVSALGSLSFSHVLLLKEAVAAYLLALLDSEKLDGSPWEPEEVVWTAGDSKRTTFYRPYAMVSYMEKAMEDGLRSWISKADDDFYDALHGWANEKLFVDFACWDETPESKLRERFRKLPEQQQMIARRNMQRFSARTIPALPKEKRVPLYLELNAIVKSMGQSREAKVIEEYFLRPYRKQYPDEWKDAPEKAAITAETPYGPSFTAMLYSLQSLSERLGLPGLYEKVTQDLGRKLVKEDIPSQGSHPTAAEDERLLESVREKIVAAKMPSGELRMRLVQPVYQAMMIFRQEEGYVSEDVVESGGWGEAVLNLLLREMKPWIPKLREYKEREGIPDWNQNYEKARDFHFNIGIHFERTLSHAVELLPPKQIDELGRVWQREVQPWFPNISYDGLKGGVLAAIHLRGATPLEFLTPLLQAYTARWPQSAEAEFVISELYAANRPETDAAAREIVQRFPLPVGTEMYKRRHWNQPYQWMMYTAWTRHDSEMLAVSLERCALPFYWKGNTSLLPVIEQAPEYTTSAPQTFERGKGGIPLLDIWRLVYEKQRERVPTILQNLFAIVELEELPLALLPIVASEFSEGDSPLTAYVPQLLEMAESSQDAVVKVAFAVFSEDLRLASGRREDLLKACRRSLASVAPGVVNAATAFLGNFAAGDPSVAEPARELLFESLHQENVPSLEQALKSLKKSLRKGEKLIFTNTVVERLNELAAREERLAKLVKALL